MATRSEGQRTHDRPPVILLVAGPDIRHQPLEAALRRAGAVLICADPDAAPGYLEASDWPGVAVKVPNVVLALGPGSEGLARKLRARPSAPPVLTAELVPEGAELGHLVARALALLRTGATETTP